MVESNVETKVFLCTQTDNAMIAVDLKSNGEGLFMGGRVEETQFGLYHVKIEQLA